MRASVKANNLAATSGNVKKKITFNPDQLPPIGDGRNAALNKKEGTAGSQAALASQKSSNALATVDNNAAATDSSA
jgi:hypothetical protein